MHSPENLPEHKQYMNDAMQMSLDAMFQLSCFTALWTALPNSFQFPCSYLFSQRASLSHTGIGTLRADPLHLQQSQAVFVWLLGSAALMSVPTSLCTRLLASVNALLLMLAVGCCIHTTCSCWTRVGLDWGGGVSKAHHLPMVSAHRQPATIMEGIAQDMRLQEQQARLAAQDAERGVRMSHHIAPDQPVFCHLRRLEQGACITRAQWNLRLPCCHLLMTELLSFSGRLQVLPEESAGPAHFQTLGGSAAMCLPQQPITCMAHDKMRFQAACSPRQAKAAVDHLLETRS